eukprot:TRINITY_DN833_c0_g1_i1.p1 TRINITY_DN833_c0_g1~~TRINITY_DN833_c0_g1_i1.p1  ORF type:complete len:1122 (+),score=261.05 TRINITY_DN833_c0_g1_i1:42-3407(+)
MAFQASCKSIAFTDESSKSFEVFITNNSGEEAEFKAKLTHPAIVTCKPAKGTIPAAGLTVTVSVKDWDAGKGIDKLKMLLTVGDSWKERIQITIGGEGGGGSAPVAAVPTISKSPVDMSPAGSPNTVPPFTISATLKKLSTTDGAPLTGSSYSISWKRSNKEGTTKSYPPSGTSVDINETAVLADCKASYKDGKVLRKFLVFTIHEDGVPFGNIKFTASECSASEKSGEVPVKPVPGSATVINCVVDMVVTMTPAGGAVAEVPPQPRAEGQYTAGKRMFIPPPVAASPSAELFNPLEEITGGANAIPKDQNIQVLVRMRPPSSDDCVWKITSDRSLTDDEREYEFDYVFPTTINNNDCWDAVGPRFIDAVTTGINGTIFMYGQTGSGKTHTMFGTPTQPGLTPLLFGKLFEKLNVMRTEKPNSDFSVKASYFEIYKDEVNDLLVTDSKKGRNLPIRDAKGHFFVQGLVVKSVKSRGDCSALLEHGGKMKAMGQSLLNDVSSRSHTIFSITVVEKCTTGGRKRETTATLNFCDLAGSEEMNVEGDAKQRGETVEINKALTYLKSVIKQLANNERHVSYRDSRLTKILKQSLGGNARTSIIVTIHPGAAMQKDARNSLQFGQVARTVKNRARVNAQYEDANLQQQVKMLKETVKGQEGELMTLRQIAEDYMKLSEEFTRLQEENERLKAGGAVLAAPGTVSADGQVVQQTGDAPQNVITTQLSENTEGLIKKLNEKDREIIDLKIEHGKELMQKTIQLQQALEEMEQEETALELVQKDERLDQLVLSILSYLHFGTKVLRIDPKTGEAHRKLLYLQTESSQQHICICPLAHDGKGKKQDVQEKIPVREIKKTQMGQYGSSFAKTKRAYADGEARSFSIVGKKGKRIDVISDTPSDFEAWIQSLSYLSPSKEARPAWGEDLEISKMEGFEKLDSDEKALCRQIHVTPADYMHARSQVLNKEGRFVTLYDVRSLSCIDLYHSLKLFTFFMTKGWIRQRKLHHLDTEVIMRTTNAYEQAYDEEDATNSYVEPTGPASTYGYQDSTYAYQGQAPPGGGGAYPAGNSYYNNGDGGGGGGGNGSAYPVSSNYQSGYGATPATSGYDASAYPTNSSYQPNAGRGGGSYSY